MKTIVAHGAHDLRIEDRDMPVPGPGQVLVRLEAGGICGSDLHYYHQGGFGAVRLKEPMILGHEVAGRIEDLGAGVSGLAKGLRVAVSPSRPCHACRFCHAGQPNHCLNMRFYGSAMPFPHIQGAFREFLVADVAQCAPAGDLSAGEAAMAEPLSVVLHAARRAGDLLGKRVLVTGCGPIGMLAVLVARAAGAAEIVATDLSDFTLDMAARLGADRVVNMGKHPDGLAPLAAEKGQIDVLFECSGAAPALVAAIPAMRPGGVILQLGLGGDMTLPVQAITAKELELRGSFRFHEEFFAAVELMRKGRIDVKPLITHEVALDEAEEGFMLASDRSRAMKAQIRFS
ncbi:MULTISPECIES: L-idonate 5-dehydrogenase [unclassified Mameliella]|uniref:L-idonate 5-dehydrogenase n=1 Tax=unclassified Mameliella TaxID=2630630 RepID=UPI00273F22FA|nr:MULTISPECIES: L-idonate 5-dehydrogenase [unclassified Mameliella]